MEILHSNIIGEGEPLLILHGFLGMSDNWKTLGNKYAENGFQVHLIDQRNHGRSFHSDLFNYDILAEDLYNYIEHHNLKAVNLIGHSMGGKTVMLFAVTYPDVVKKIIIADIAPKYYPPHHEQILAGLSALDFSKIDSRQEADDTLAKYITDFGTRQFLLKNVYRKSKDEYGLRINIDVLKHAGNDIGEALPSFSEFDKPTLFLRGSKSEYVMPNDETLIHTHFPEAIIKTVANAGHWLHAENPTDFFEYSLAFLQNN
jgi:pimeloyl-ACP methyl ester carboxylesterase